MEASKRFKQTQIDSEKTNDESNAARDRVNFDISTVYVPLDEAGAAGGVD